MKRSVIVAGALLLLSVSAIAGTENAVMMTQPRYQHAAVGLLDGRALIAGGVTNAGFTAVAETYDPVTATLTAVAPMSTARASPAAVRLADGRVLVVGGSGVGPSGTFGLTTAEIFDPATNTWSATGEMAVGRRAPLAAMLQNGNVLVVGGELNVMSAEVYDAATGTFSSTTAFGVQRYDYAVAAMGDGRVMLSGGIIPSTGNQTTVVEIWDPASGTWTATTFMVFARSRHTATLLPDGRTLITGGTGVAAAEIFDPATGAFTTTGGLVTARMYHAAAVMGDGNVMIAGGTNPSGTTLGTLERYHVATGTWRAAGVLHTSRRGIAATTLADGDVLFSGGILSGGQASPITDLVDPACNVALPTLTPASLLVGPAGGPASVAITHVAGCRWRVNGFLQTWITINIPTAGNGDGTVTLTLAANTTISNRFASGSVGDVSIQLTQAGNPCAAATLSPTSQSFPSTGGNGTTTLSGAAGCPWTVSGAPSWVTIASGGTGNGAIAYSVAANTGAARNATITIAGRTLAITQSGNPCVPAPTISPTSRSVGQFATSFSVVVTANAACSWAVTGIPSWVHMPLSGTGTRPISISVDSNPATLPRSASFTIAGQAFVLTQAANFCATSTASPSSQTVGNGGDAASVTVTALPECAWSLTGSIPAWITFTSSTSGAGNAVLTMSIAPNVADPARSAYFYVGYGSFEIRQAAGSCYPAETIAPTVDSASATGGSRSVQVTANPGCPWAITQVPPWITLTSPASGSGSSTVTYDIAPNVSYARSGTLLIGARSLAVSQGAPGLATLPGPALNVARAGHGIAALDDRRILVAGGYADEGNAYASALASVEIYDPATGAFTLAAPMARPRSQHVTAKVGYGRVLVAGGSNAEGGGSNTLADAELFDPYTGAWTPTGSLPVARTEASSVVLWNGRVLVVGGRNGTTSLNDSVLYDPATGTWTPSGNVVQPRINGALALTGAGTVLYAGGYSPTTGEYLASAETWDAATGVWTPTGSMSSARSNFTITESGGLMVVAGGYNGSGPSPVNAEVYSPGNGTFTPTGALKGPRSEHSALRLPDGGVVVIGGGSSPAIERFDWQTGAWRTIGVLTDDRRGARIAMSIPDGRILVIGGFPGPRRVSEAFDPSLCSPVGSLSPTSHSVPSGASDTYAFNVTLNHAPCLQVTASQAPWIGNIRISQGTGSGTITYSVTANTTGAPRTGTISVAGATFTVTQAAASTTQSYCASSGTTSYEWIQGMTLAGVTQTTGNNGGYSDRTSSWTYPLTRSGLNPITLVPSGSYSESWRVWIDFNRDGVFSDTEMVYGGSSTGTINSGFSIPSTAPSGTTRMRVSMRYGSSPLACGSFSYGEVEDYTVSIP